MKLFFILSIFLLNSCFALDITQIQSFSAQSKILNTIEKDKNYVPQEQRDLIKSKKMALTSESLIQQIKKNKYDNVKLLLDCKLDPNEPYFTDYPITISAKYNKFEILELLYEYGAQIDRGFSSELYYAIKNKNHKMAMFLIERNANFNYRDEFSNYSILALSLKNNMPQVELTLIQKGANIDINALQLIKKKKLTLEVERILTTKGENNGR